jgi:hypothetical protein
VQSYYLSSSPVACIRDEGLQAVAGAGNIAIDHWTPEAAHPVVGCYQQRKGLLLIVIQRCLVVVYGDNQSTGIVMGMTSHQAMP